MPKKGHSGKKSPHKKKLTSYFRFAAEKRDEVKSSYPDLKATEVAKKLGEMWRELSDEEKQHWKDIAEQDAEERHDHHEEDGD